MLKLLCENVAMPPLTSIVGELVISLGMSGPPHIESPTCTMMCEPDALSTELPPASTRLITGICSMFGAPPDNAGQIEAFAGCCVTCMEWGVPTCTEKPVPEELGFEAATNCPAE